MARKTAPKGRPTGVTVKRRPGYIYFVDGAGNVRETRRSTGGKPGRKRCYYPGQVSQAEHRALERAKRHPGSISEADYRLLMKTHRRTTGRK